MRKKRTFQIHGRVVESSTQGGVIGLRVEAWDKDPLRNDLIGDAITGEQGLFKMIFDETRFQHPFPERRPDIFFRVYQNDQLIKTTEDAVLWNIEAETIFITIEVAISPQPQPPAPYSTIEINSLEELSRHEKEILRRIASTPNGGLLFHVNPFLLFADIQVVLSDQARQEIIRIEPSLSVVSEITYNHLKASNEPQKVRINLRGLFQNMTS